MSNATIACPVSTCRGVCHGCKNEKDVADVTSRAGILLCKACAEDRFIELRPEIQSFLIATLC